MTLPSGSPPRCVLDTQVLLDWVLFDDPRTRAWADAIEHQRVAWIYGPAMQSEALRVVHYPALARRFDPVVSAAKIAERFARLGQCCAEPLGQRQLICSDADDQMFLDLALAQTAATLLSRDRAVLRLARSARNLGLVIGTPENIDAP